MLVTPSILVSTPADLVSQMLALLPYCNHFQIDIADGKYVQNTTISPDEIVNALFQNTDKLATSCKIDFHLMVLDYQSVINTLSKLSGIFTIDTILIHADLTPTRTTTYIPEHSSIGLVFNPSDNVHLYCTKHDLTLWDSVQVMSVVPGMQGQPFIKDSYKLIDALKANNYTSKIYLDGAINATTLETILQWQNVPDVIGPGSYFSKSSSILKTAEEIVSIGQKYNQEIILKEEI